MRLKHFLLALALIATSLYGQDCVPASMQYIGKRLNFNFTVERAAEVCQTDAVGTDIDNIMPAWEVLTRQRSYMMPIYVMPAIGNVFLDRKLAPYRTLCRIEKPIQVGEFEYLWVGLRNNGDGKFYTHCAVVIFLEDGVKMISPNSQDAEGKMLEEEINYKDFFAQTFIVFDIMVRASGPRYLTTL